MKYFSKIFKEVIWVGNDPAPDGMVNYSRKELFELNKLKDDPGALKQIHLAKKILLGTVASVDKGG